MRKILKTAMLMLTVLMTAMCVTAKAADGEFREFYDFNSAATGARPPVFYIVESDNTSVKVENFPDSADKSVAIEGTANNAFMQRSFDTSPITGKVFFETDMRFDSVNSSALRLEIKSSAGGTCVFLTMSNGMITLYDGTLLAKYIENKFYTVSVSLDLEQQKANVWIDGRKRIRDLSIAGLNMPAIAHIRLQLTQIKSYSKVNLDNMTYAVGMEEPENTQEDETMTDNTQNAATVEEKMKNAAAFYKNRKYALINAVKTELGAAPFEENGELFVPIREIAGYAGGRVVYNANDNSVQLKHGEDVYIIPCAGGKILKNGSETDEILAKTIDGKMYLSANTCGKIFGKYIFEDKLNGFVIFSNEENFISWDKNYDLLNSIAESFIYTDYTGEELISMLKAKNPNNAHPRVIADANTFERIRELIKTDEFAKKSFEAVMKEADSYLTQEPSKYEIPDGIRLLDTSRRVERRVATLAMAYNLTFDEKYAQRAWQELYLAAYFPNWNPKHFLDPSEMIAGFAYGYDWLYDWLGEEKRAILRKAMIEYGLNQVMDDYEGRERTRTYKWSESVPPNNWTFVCNGGMAMGALAIAGDDEETDILCGQVLSYGLQNVKRALKLFAPSGSYGEGPSYWSYATNYFGHYLKAIESAYGSDLGYFDVPGVSETVEFVESMNAPAGFFNYSDAAASSVAIRPAQVMWFADKLNKPYLASNRIKDVMKGVTVPIWEDLIYYKPEFTNTDMKMPLDKYSDIVETMTMRSSYNDDAMYVGFHNGNNNESHTHYDKGGFIIDSQGERFVMDLGYDDYNLPGRTFDRYRYRAEGHNTLVFNPDGEYDQKNATAKIIRHESKEKGAYAISDLSDIYADDVQKALRGIMLNEGRTAVTVEDEITMKERGEVWWFAHTDADIELSPCGKTAVLTKNGKKMKVQILSEGIFEVMDAKPLPSSPVIEGQNENAGIRKLAIHLTDFEEGRIIVGFSNYYDGYEFSEVKPLDKWSISDGALEYAAVSDIKINGAVLADFSPDVYAYSVEVPVNQTYASIVESDGKVTDMRENGSKYGTVTVTGSGNDKQGKTYVITFEHERFIGIPEGYKRIDVKKYTASDEPQPENSAANAFDSSYETRWAALGECSMDIDLGSVKKIDGVGIAFWKGDQRTSKLKIETSEDGKSYSTVFEGDSCGTTEDSEVFTTDGINARYVRTTFYGTSAGNWNSILDISILNRD